LAALRDAGYAIVALTPAPDAADITEAPALLRRGGRPRVALLLGGEGPGLSGDALAAADLRVRIPMRTDLIDSLNVGAASAIALHRFTEGASA
jgi:tRNA G18 (ribose-2'-O)-methylase SpoU